MIKTLFHSNKILENYTHPVLCGNILENRHTWYFYKYGIVYIFKQKLANECVRLQSILRFYELIYYSLFLTVQKFFFANPCCTFFSVTLAVISLNCCKLSLIFSFEMFSPSGIALKHYTHFQFPIKLCFTATINTVGCQTLKQVGRGMFFTLLKSWFCKRFTYTGTQRRKETNVVYK
jgi:hypothetical protein